MIENLLHQLTENMALQLQFRLSHKTLAKFKWEWSEVDSNPLSLTEWEDLKDLCLLSHEKLQLETKGFVKGFYKTNQQNWNYSFIEHKDCMKAHFTVIPNFSVSQNLLIPSYWDSFKRKNGLHIVSSEKGHGKSTFLKELIQQMTISEPKSIAVHSLISPLNLINDESVLHLSEDTLNWDTHHPIYDGIDVIVVDYNSIKNWEKWVHFVEEGRTVILTMSGISTENILMQIQSQISTLPKLMERFIEVIQSIVFQKIVNLQAGALHEIVVFNHELKNIFKESNDLKLARINEEKFKLFYQTLNTSIVQNLVRRKLDVKTAFQFSSNPDELDQILKRMGL